MTWKNCTWPPARIDDPSTSQISYHTIFLSIWLIGLPAPILRGKGKSKPHHRPSLAPDPSAPLIRDPVRKKGRRNSPARVPVDPAPKPTPKEGKNTTACQRSRHCSLHRVLTASPPYPSSTASSRSPSAKKRGEEGIPRRPPLARPHLPSASCQPPCQRAAASKPQHPAAASKWSAAPQPRITIPWSAPPQFLPAPARIQAVNASSHLQRLSPWSQPHHPRPPPWFKRPSAFIRRSRTASRSYPDPTASSPRLPPTFRIRLRPRL